MAEIKPVDILEDIKKVYNVAGRISKRLYAKHGAYSERQVKKHFGGSFGKAFERAGLIGKAPQPGVSTEANAVTNEYVGSTWNITIPRTHISTLDELLTERKVDLDIWAVDRYKIKQWEMGSKDANDNAVITPLYAVSATLVKRKAVEFAQIELASLKEKYLADLVGVNEHIYTIRPNSTETGNMLEINVPDLHAGKLAWSKETGYKDYDTKIALDRFDAAVDALLARSSHIHFDKILFIVGNDLIHSDTIAGTTTNGTHLDNDSRYHKVFVKVRNRLIDTIKYKLLPLAPVLIVGCPGNHDKLSAWHVTDSLQMYFHEYADVEVDNSPEEFKFVQWGEVMLMFAHGNTGKKLDYPLTMATKRKQMWAETTYREAHTGHVHQTMVQEFHGVRVRTFPALCEPDAWHAANNYVGNILAAEAYAWNKHEGLINKAFYNAP